MDLENTTLQSTSATNANDSSSQEDYDWDFYWKVYEYCTLFVIILTIITVFCGLTSWILIRKWRTFKNYVFINVSAAAIFKHLIDYIVYNSYLSVDENYFIVLYNLYISAVFAYNLWLLVLCVIFYSAIVKIFKPPVYGRFWKSALLGWGSPTVLGAINYLSSNIPDQNFAILDFIIISLSYLISFVVFFMYTIVLWTLLKRRSDIRSSKFNISAKIQMATLLTLMSGIASVACNILDVVTKTRGLFVLMLDNADLLPSIIVAIWVLIAKSNRTLWQDYYRTKLRNSVNSATIDMA